MPMDFTIIIHVRHQFGAVDKNIGVFAGTEASFTFDCPAVDSSRHSLLLFQSLGVDREQGLEVNGSSVFGGVPHGDVVVGRTGSAQGHTHPLNQHGGWRSNVMVVNQSVLRDSGNVLRIFSRDQDDDFYLDNLVLLYKTRSTIIAGGVDEVATARSRKTRAKAARPPRRGGR